MTDKLDDAALEAIRALCDAATPGPWTAHIGEDGGGEFYDPVVLAGEQFIAQTSYDGLSATVARPDGYSREADARFIAAARAAVPALLAALDAERAENGRLLALIDLTAKHWLDLQRTHPIRWEGAVDAAMQVACAEIKAAKAKVGRLRPEVWAFAHAMESRLRVNDHKGGWQSMSPEQIILRMKEEAEELWLEVDGYSPLDKARVLNEAADVANFAMMVADVCAALKETAP